MPNAVGDGAVSRGYAVYFNRPGVAVVTWDPTLRSVYVDVQGWADSIELAALMEAGLQALTEHGGSRWLADGRKLKGAQTLRPEIVDEFVSRALAAGLRRVALVIPNEDAMRAVDRLVSGLPAAKADVACFATVDEARAWLNSITET